MSPARPKHPKPPQFGKAPSPERARELGRIFSVFGLEPHAEALELLDLAFIHRSHRCESGGDHDNERLEFLGDSVIGLICTEFLLESHPGANEGELSKLKAAMVSRTVLGEVAAGMELGMLLRLGTGEERSGGRERRSTLGSALEAVCGALYLHYPWEELRPAIVREVLVPARVFTGERLQHDYKSMLQEWTQKRGEGVPEYRLVGETGPEHDRRFRVEAWVGGRMLGSGEGKRKKQAENDAARQAVRELGLESGPDSRENLVRDSP